MATLGIRVCEGENVLEKFGFLFWSRAGESVLPFLEIEGFQAVFVVESADNRLRSDSVTFGKPMSMAVGRNN